MASDLMTVITLKCSVLRCFVSQSADVYTRQLRAAALTIALQSRSRWIQNERLASNHEHLLRWIEAR